MAAIFALVDGVTELTEDALNQYKDALSATLGITDTAQDALGRLVLPKLTTAQRTALSPSEAQVVYDTDVKAPYFYNGTTWIKWGTIRQMLETRLGSDTSLGTGMTASISQAITTTGGQVLVLASVQVFGTKDASAGVNSISVELRRGATVLTGGVFRGYTVGVTQIAGQLPLHYLDSQPAGTYTYQVYGQRESGFSNAQIDGGDSRTTLTLIEIG